jgi:hypothetical protein
MTQPISDGNDDDLDLDAPLTVTDYAEIIADTIDEAVGNLEYSEIEPLCRAIRDKIGAILQENRRWRPDPDTDRDPNDRRWWDR